MPASLSVGDTRFLSHAKSHNVVFRTHPISRAFLLVMFCAISGAFQAMCGVKGVEEAGEVGSGVRQGSWSHKDMVCALAQGATKGQMCWVF